MEICDLEIVRSDARIFLRSVGLGNVTTPYLDYQDHINRGTEEEIEKRYEAGLLDICKKLHSGEWSAQRVWSNTDALLLESIVKEFDTFTLDEVLEKYNDYRSEALWALCTSQGEYVKYIYPTLKSTDTTYTPLYMEEGDARARLYLAKCLGIEVSSPQSRDVSI